jgi:hypothetical protein
VGFIFWFSASAFAQDYGKEHYSPNSPNYMAGQQHYLIKNESSSALTEQQPDKGQQLENPAAATLGRNTLIVLPVGRRRYPCSTRLFNLT